MKWLRVGWFSLGLITISACSSGPSQDAVDIAIADALEAVPETTVSGQDVLPPTTRATTSTSLSILPEISAPPLELYVDDLPIGSPDTMLPASVSFVQRLISHISQESILDDGTWGVSTADAFNDAQVLLDVTVGATVEPAFWREVFRSGPTELEIDGTQRISADFAGLQLPASAILWRTRTSDVGDPIFLSEQQFILVGAQDGSEILEQLLALNPELIPIESEIWPSWIGEPGATDEASVGYYGSVHIGDCFDFPTSSNATVRRLPCDVPHDAQMLLDQTVPAWLLETGRYPSDDDADRLFDEVCLPKADEFRSTWLEPAENLDIALLTTIEDDWDLEQGMSCVWISYDGSLLEDRVEPDSGAELISTVHEQLLGAFTISVGTDVFMVGVIDKGGGRIDIAVGRLQPE